MQPTMPMQQWGGPGGGAPGGGGGPGQPPGGGGNWTPPPVGGPPMGGPPAMGPPPAPKKSGGILKYILGGCGCVVLLGICVSLGVYFGASQMFGVEHTRYPVTAGQPYSFQFQTSGDGEHVVWIDYDLSHTSPWMLTGNISVATAAGVPLKSVQLTMSAEGAPTSEGGSRVNMNSTSTNVNGNGSASGVTRLFAIPAQPNGTTLIVSGTVMPSAGTTLTSGAMVIRR